ncbi:MAG TPA: class I SAM-dependent methyltransferase [Pyrinomonadaceae bacterium]|nr:class I SAM-dependent methyltransferase [Pyrinomonadaceae bacterium]
MKLCTGCDRTFEGSRWRCPHCLYEPAVIDNHIAFAPDLARESEGFEADYFARLADQEAGNFWFRSRNRLVVWALRRYFPKAQNFLEIGCGTGFVLSGIKEAFPNLALSGSEVFSEGLTFAATRLPAVELFQMDARRIPFRNEFDLVGAFDVLEHVKEDEEVLGQMYEATRKGGGILITVPHHRFLWSPVDEFARHVRRYETRELTEKVERAGFSVLRVTSFVSLLLPLLVASRFKQRGKPVDPSAEYKMSPTLNTVLEKILDAERTVIQSGLSFPAGGSLLLVARRNEA